MVIQAVPHSHTYFKLNIAIDLYARLKQMQRKTAKNQQNIPTCNERKKEIQLQTFLFLMFQLSLISQTTLQCLNQGYVFSEYNSLSSIRHVPSSLNLVFLSHKRKTYSKQWI